MAFDPKPRFSPESGLVSKMVKIYRKRWTEKRKRKKERKTEKIRKSRERKIDRLREKEKDGSMKRQIMKRQQIR